jgi:hypothetical protein
MSLIDDYLKAAQPISYLQLPQSEQQKGSYAELMIGDLLNQADVGLWFHLVRREYQALFPVLPDNTRYYYSVLKN